MRSYQSCWLKLCLLALMGGGVLLGISACGKLGNPQPPGPANKVTYPQPYPPE